MHVSRTRFAPFAAILATALGRPRLSLPGSILAGALLTFAMPLYAQTASYNYINQRPPYDPAINMLTALNLPRVGTTFNVSVPNGQNGCLGWVGETSDTYYLAFGLSNPNVPIPALGGFLFTSADIVLPAPRVCPNTGSVTMSCPIPNSPGLLGMRFYQQVLHVHVDFWVAQLNFNRLGRGGVGLIGR